MKFTEPILSSISQVFSIETLEALNKKRISLTPKIEWGEDRTVSLRNRDTSIKQQWNGTCTSFAVVAAIENRLGGQIDLSERSLWDEYGAYSTQEAIDTAKTFFILEEKFWPQHQRRLDRRAKGKGRYKLINVDYLENDYSKVLNAIDNGNPCVVALSTPTDLHKGKTQVEADSSFIKKSGHALCVSGYKVESGKGYFLVKNSWGLNCGDNGYQFVAFDLFKGDKYAIFWEIVEIFDRGEQKINIFEEEDSLYQLTEL